MKIKFGAIVTDGRGKIGGHVASKNRGGAYLRTKVTPTNPQTTAQLKARGVLTSLSQAWSALSDDARLAWNSAVSSWSATDIFGDIKKPTGLNLFIKINTNLANIDQPALNLPPEKIELPVSFLIGATYDVSTGVMVLNFDSSASSGIAVLVRATPALSQGVSFVKSQLRVIGYEDQVSTEVTLTGNYADKFGSISAGDNVYVTAQFVLPSGQKSIESKIKLVVSA
jgi:hypothetical protein